MVAERSTQPASSEAMANPRPGSLRQPSLADEIDEIEQAELVTNALRAVESSRTQHGPEGQQPQEQHPGVSNTPGRKPKIGKTPSPVRIDADATEWTHEDDHESEEEKEKQEKEDNENNDF